MGILIVIGCGDGKDDEGECAGDACGAGDVVEELAHPFCPEAHVLSFSQGTTTISLLNAPGSDLLDDAQTLSVQLLDADTGEVLAEKSAGTEDPTLFTLDAVDGETRVTIKVQAFKADAEEPYAEDQ